MSLLFCGKYKCFWVSFRRRDGYCCSSGECEGELLRNKNWPHRTPRAARHHGQNAIKRCPWPLGRVTSSSQLLLQPKSAYKLSAEGEGRRELWGEMGGWGGQEGMEEERRGWRKERLSRRKKEEIPSAAATLPFCSCLDHSCPAFLRDCWETAG